MQVVEKQGDRGIGTASRNAHHSVGFSAFLVSLGTLTSRILGYFRDMLMAAMFSRFVTDAWIIAFRLPNMFRRIFGEGALSVSFIPVFVGLMKSGREDDAKKLAHGIFTLLLGVLIPLTVSGIIFPRWWVSLLVSSQEYGAIEGKMELTIELSRIMFVYCLLVCIYAYYMAILNGLRQFMLAAFAPALWNVAMIAAIFWPGGQLAHAQAWGVVIGGIAQVAVLIPALLKQGYFPRVTFNFWTRDTLQVFRGLGPSLIGLGILQVMMLANTRFASQLPQGSNSWIFWADRILELPLALFAVSLGTALLPTLSGLWAEGKLEDFRKSSNYYLRSVLFLSFPSALGIGLLSKPIVEVLFRRGYFSDDDAVQTALVLKIYSIAVVVYSIIRVLAPCYYAMKNTWFPAVSSFIALIIHLTLAPIFMREWGLGGLISSMIFSTTLNMIFLVLGAKHFFGGIGVRRICQSLGRFSIGGAAIVAFSQAYEPILVVLTKLLGLPRLSEILSLALVIFIAALGYIGIMNWMGVEEFGPVQSRLKKYFRRS